MNITPLLAVPAIVMAAPATPKSNLPSPTPGLPEIGNAISFAALTQGRVVQEFVANHHTYTVRNIRQFLLLYNEQGHVVALVRGAGEEINFACGERDGDPFPQGGPSAEFILDGIAYTARAITMKDGTEIFAIYFKGGSVIFAVLSPEAVMIPNPPKPL